MYQEKIEKLIKEINKESPTNQNFIYYFTFDSRVCKNPGMDKEKCLKCRGVVVSKMKYN